jgi:tetratricopeptide (TPR) repeat protein/SAM-dependent methyltransferase
MNFNMHGDDSLPWTPASTIDQVFRQAVARHRAGLLEEAEHIYRELLQAHPNHPEANYEMGVLAVQRKLPTAGLPYFTAALDADPARGQYWVGYIDALFQAGETEAAREILTRARLQGLEGAEAEALTLRMEAHPIQSGPAGPQGPQAFGSTPLVSPEYNPDPREIDAFVTLFAARRFTEAASVAQAMTERYPSHGIGWKALGAAFNQIGRSTDALVPMQKAAAMSPDDIEVHYNLGVVLQELGRLGEAEACYRRALRINPGYAHALCNLGTILQELGRVGDAETFYRRAIQARPDYAKAHRNLGAALHDLGRLDEAEASYRQALRIMPEDPETQYNLGVTLMDLGRPGDAEACCRHALRINPYHADTHFHLGNILHGLNRLDDADACYQRALDIKPDFVGALNNRALLFNAQGKSMMALDSIGRSLRTKETADAKRIFVTCVKRLRLSHDDGEIRALMVRALTEPWGRPGELAMIGSELIKLNPEVGGAIARASHAWPRRLSAKDLFGAKGLTAVATDTLLCTLLDSAPVCGVEMERFLTMARCAMLEATTEAAATNGEEDAILRFRGALARQCFITEYVFSNTNDEFREASALKASLIAALDANTPIPALWPLAVAAYFPLHSLPLVARLLDREWPDAVAAVIAQQVREPAEELQLRAAIPRLTGIEDKVSLLVQSQYEENPYPRWIKAAPGGEAKNIVANLCQRFPLASFTRRGKSGDIDVLIAGCGTGQHSIAATRRIKQARVLAVDLSTNSLAYAKRKTQELGLTSIEYAQADLLQLGSLNRSFDVIESSGVLHHLADPWTGWKVLLSLLRPGGFMNVGLYSEAARRDIVRIRNIIAERGYGSTSEEIRRCRQDLMASDHAAEFAAILSSPDFFSISACRDLLFHVQEHRMTLTAIEAFLNENNLAFLGFEIEGDVLNAYKQRFPDDIAATKLGQWRIFENENSDTFANMYQFWIQKAA